MRKIIVVDDEVEIVKILKGFLTKTGFDVVTASSAEEALPMITDDENIELLILDKRMPGKGGVGLLRDIRSIGRSLPVIMVTGSIDVSEFHDELEKLDCRIEDVILKPVDLFMLLEVVKKKLGMR